MLEDQRTRLYLQTKRLMGGEKELASPVGVKQPTVNKWVNHAKRKMAYDKALLIEEHWGIPASVSRPDSKANRYLREHYALIKLALQYVKKKEIIIPDPFPEFYLGPDRPIIIGNDGVLISGIETFKVQPLSKTGHLRVAILDLKALWEERYSLKYIELLPMEHLAIGSRIEQILGNHQGQRNDLERPHPISQKLSTKENFELCLSCDEVDERKDEKLARVSGLKSKDAYHRLKQIRRLGIPELIQSLNYGELSISAAVRIAKLSEEGQKAELQFKRASISKQKH